MEKYNTNSFHVQMFDSKKDRWVFINENFWLKEKAEWYVDYMQDFLNTPLRVVECNPVAN